jgi:hypothetical protein
MAHVGCVEILKSRTQIRFVSSSAFSLNISPMLALCPIRYKNQTPSPSLEVCILTCKTSLFQKDWICVGMATKSSRLDNMAVFRHFLKFKKLGSMSVRTLILKTPHIDICCVCCVLKKTLSPSFS